MGKNAGERLATWTNKIEHFVTRLEALHHCGLAPRPQAHTFCAPASKRFAALTRLTSSPSTLHLPHREQAQPRTRSSGRPHFAPTNLRTDQNSCSANSQISRRGSCALLIWPSVWPIAVWPIGVWPWPRLAADLSLPIAQIRHRHNHFGWRQRMRGACAG